VDRAVHANDAAAQTFFYEMFDAIQELNIPVQDVDTGFALSFFREQHKDCFDAAAETWKHVAPSKVIEQGG
jgi:hypothetical protein